MMRVAARITFAELLYLGLSHDRCTVWLEHDTA